MKSWGLTLICVVLTFTATAASAQGAAGGTALELTAGHAGFVDDATMHHGLVGGSFRWYLTPRVSLGPEVTDMHGPREQRNLSITGNVIVDLFSPTPARRWTPFVVAGAGFFRHSERIGEARFSSSEGSFTVGAGVRVNLGQRWFTGGECRVGWELHSRLNGIVGVRMGS